MSVPRWVGWSAFIALFAGTVLLVFFWKHHGGVSTNMGKKLLVITVNFEAGTVDYSVKESPKVWQLESKWESEDEFKLFGIITPDQIYMLVVSFLLGFALSELLHQRQALCGGQCNGKTH